jgi:processive 1,2-diacylglycerol beta-glucosyltransferase
MFENVLVLSASAGAGHLRAAQAIEKALNASGIARRVRHVDTLEHTTKVFRDLYSRGYLQMVNRAPEMLGWLYDHLDRPYANEHLRRAFNKLNTARFVKLLKDERPDVAVCTHFLPAEIISRLKLKGRMRCPLSVVVTDLDVHAMWLNRACDRYFVALEETRVHLCKLGVPAERVSVTGIPIDPAFAEPVDRRAARAELGLPAEGTIILVSAGGFGVGPIERLITVLLELRRPAHVVVICGRNEALKSRIAALARGGASGSGVEVRPIGYTTQMDRYMAAADLLVGKPGGLTSSEALARRLPMVIVNPIPGQEERNADHLLEEGAAIRCNNLPALAFKIDRLFEEPGRLDDMRGAAGRLARPDAALAVVRQLAACDPGLLDRAGRT